MEINNKEIGKFLTKNNLWDKPLRKWEGGELERFIEVIFEFTKGIGVMEPPSIDDSGRLLIPHNTAAKYKYWCDGSQTVGQILKELGASEEVAKRYLHPKAMEEFRK